MEMVQEVGGIPILVIRQKQKNKEDQEEQEDMQ